MKIARFAAATATAFVLACLPASAAKIEVDRCARANGSGSFVTGLTAKRGTERFTFVIGQDVSRRIAFDPYLAERWILQQIGSPGDFARYTICGTRPIFEFDDDRFPFRRSYRG